jgi:flagellar biosynthetic protein FliR
MEPLPILILSGKIFEHLDVVWTFILLLTRFTGFFTFIPGIGMGERGLVVRLPAIIVMSFAAMNSSPHAAVPTDLILMAVTLVSEYLLGLILGMIPMIMVAGVQTAVQLASTTMGLGMGNLIDPTLGIQVSDISRIVGDITIILFLMLGGHYVVLHAVAGMGGHIIPGSFTMTDFTLDLMIDRTAAILKYGIILSAPVIVALMLTNFVMGLITKAVPTVNIFIISFPLTIGIGLVLIVLSMPDISREMTMQIAGIENQVLEVVRDTQQISDQPSAVGSQQQLSASATETGH